MAALSCGPAGPAAVEIAAPAVTVAPDPAEKDDAAATAGCWWSGGVLWGREALPLCFEKDGACFASADLLFRGKVVLWLPPGDPAQTGARLDLGVDGIRLRAWTDADLVVLHPKKPVVLGQIAVVLDAEQIRADRLADRSLDLSLRQQHGISPRNGALRGRVPCTDTALDDTSYSDEAIRGAIGAAPAPLGERMLLAGQALSISASASGPPVADVTPDGSDSRVELLEQSGGRSRIVWWRDDLVLFGWVDDKTLGPPPSGPASDTRHPGAIGGFSLAEPQGMRCNRELVLFAQVNEARQKVGAIEKGTVFDKSLPTADGVFVSVGLRTSSFSLAPGSHWIVPATALKGCE